MSMTLFHINLNCSSNFSDLTCVYLIFGWDVVNRIIYRDLVSLFISCLLVLVNYVCRLLIIIFIVPYLQKPDNVGFDVRGDVKIFDFGLAREFPKGKPLVNDTYQMSGKTGSLRYMAPEVAKEHPYNETVDVYSLSMMAWQIFAMQVPFSGYSIAMHNELVVEKGGRPKIDPKWGKKVGDWMSKAWSPKIQNRPNMRLTSKAFREEVNSYEDEIEDFSQIDASSRTAKSA